MTKVEISRQGVDGEYYYWGTYNIERKSEFEAIVRAAWEFGLHKENYRLEIKESKDETNADN